MTMREILFRGKHVLDGRWIEGFYNGVRPDLATMQTKECHRIFPLKSLAYDVVPDTVGQFTGLTDKNGKKIFEGDIVKYVDDGYVATGVARFGLYASAGAAFAGHEGFYLDWAGCDWLRKDIGFWATMRPIEIIGNIHDNPELMEGE